VAGLPDAVIRALASGQFPVLESEDEATAHGFTWQLAQEHRVDQETYVNAARIFGDKRLADMVILIGLYLTTCAGLDSNQQPSGYHLRPTDPLWSRTV